MLNNTDRENEDLNKKIYIEVTNTSQKIANDYNFVIYTWLFLLNSGGLLASLTLLKYIKQIYVFAYWIPFPLFFLVGLLFIVVAAHKERGRFVNDIKISSELFNKYRDGEITSKYYNEEIQKNHEPSLVKCILFLERWSMILFIFGIFYSSIFLFLSINDICECNR